MTIPRMTTALIPTRRHDGIAGEIRIGALEPHSPHDERLEFFGSVSPSVPAVFELLQLSDALRQDAAEHGALDLGPAANEPAATLSSWLPEEEALRLSARTLAAFVAWRDALDTEVQSEDLDLLERAWDLHRAWLTEALLLSSGLRRALSDTIVSICGNDFPWDQVMPPVKGLALLYNFAPFQDTGATVASKRLRQFGESVDVIACSFLHHKKQDPTIERIGAPYVASKYFLTKVPRWASWGAYGDFAVEAAEIAHAYIAREDRDYEFLYSRAMWAPSLYAGAMTKLRHPQLRWIAEFSDPLSLDVEGNRRGGAIPRDSVSTPLIEAYEHHFSPLPESEISIFSLAERLAFAFADEILFTNRNQFRTMIELIEDEALRTRIESHARISHHPTLPREFYQMYSQRAETDPQTLNIAYFGEFYSSRGLTEVTSAIRTLPAPLRKLVRLHVFTNYVPQTEGGQRPRNFSLKQYNDLVQRALDGVGAEGIEELVEFHPSLPYLEFLSTTEAFDLLVVVDARSGDGHPINPYLPSKWSDYRGSQAQTWAVIEEGSVLSTEPVAWVSPLGDIRGARELLWSAVEQKFGLIDPSADASPMVSTTPGRVDAR